MKNELPQKRITPSFQIVIAAYEPSEEELTTKDKIKALDLIQNSLQDVRVKKLKFEAYGIGRGASNGAWGLDITNIITTGSQAKDIVELAILSKTVIKTLNKFIGRKRKIVYSSKFIEHYCIGKILEKTKEEELKTSLFKDITGGGHEEYEYIDYYLFIFSGKEGYYFVLVDSSAKIYECTYITHYKGIKKIQL